MRKVFSPAGECIYCGSKVGKLKEEHIIALSLGGNYIIPSASCLECEKVTSFLELFAKDCMGDPRSAYRMPTRRPKNRRAFLDATIQFGPYGPEKNIKVPIDDAPINFILPHFQAVNNENEKLRSRVNLVATSANETISNARTNAILSKHHAHSVSFTTGGIKIDNFARMLWKITCGIGWVFFKAALAASSVREYVLGRLELFASDTTDETLVLDIYSAKRAVQPYSDARFALFTNTNEDHRFIYVEIDFMANLGAPLYYCRVPNLRGSPIQRIEIVQ